MQCICDHNVEKKQIYNFQKFQEAIEKKFKQYKLDDRSEINNLRQNFKSLISQTEIMMKNLLENLKDSIKQIFDTIEQEDQTYIRLINQNISIGEFSNTDLEKLVLILEGSILENWNTKKDAYFKKLENAKNQLDLETKKFSENCIIEIKDIISIIKQQFNVNFLSIQSLEQKSMINEEGKETKEIESFIFDFDQKRYICTKFEINLTKDKDLIYTKDGSILRIDKSKNSFWQKDVMTNLEQIAYLQWEGEYNKNDIKIGKWTAIFKGVKDIGGQYNNEGKKQGKWKEIFQNYWSQTIGYEVGEYFNDQRIGIWKYIFQEKEMGGGEYNQIGQKLGKWIELSTNTSYFSLVTYDGEYGMNGQKKGKWKIKYDGQKIGGGTYEEQEGVQKKNGKWIELIEGFTDNYQVIYNGEYIKGDKKGKWEILSKRKGIFSKYSQIGGGWYNDLEGSQNKIGNWIEIREELNDSRKITYNGEYSMKGQKKGRWDIIYKGKQIGGGLYDEQEGSQKKIGMWIDLREGFYNYSQIIYKGEYNNKGQKIRRWDIMYCFAGEKDYQLIGGGLYDEQINGSKKIGEWVDIWECFGYNREIIYQGQYNIKGQKKGQWDILFREYRGNEPILIGGGQYDEQDGGSRKIGMWVEISDEFRFNNQIAYSGEYDTAGKKVGKWDQIDLKGNNFGNKRKSKLMK
ncbi:unnamed protein product [Paramecium sonneborni]|uniref:Uncharacterized protein n=1 Tax=Paramecium sonneborni TaxID=65129 RepID=A0A8S1LI79_9CILI|nr:unnamed protein product [Paramecium sonneborni]